MLRSMTAAIVKASEDGNTTLLMELVHGPLSLIRTVRGDSVLQVHLRDSTRTANIIFMSSIIASDPSLLCVRNDDEDIPFHTAARSGQHAAVKLFLEREGGVYATMVNKAGDTALHIACRQNDVAVARELLCGNPNIDLNYRYTANCDGDTPLQLAVENPIISTALVDLLVTAIPASQHGHPSIGCALHSAVSKRELVIVDKITRMDRTLIRFKDCNGRTPLHYAASKCWRQGLQLLLSFDPLAAYCQDNDGQTAAHLAAVSNNVSGLEVLLDVHPDCFDVFDNDGRNVVHTAVIRGNAEVFKYFLVQSRFEHLINKKDFLGNTPLHLFADSITNLSSESVKSMRRNNVIFEIQKRMKPVFDKQNRTPMDIAAQHMHNLSKLEPPQQDLLCQFMAVAPRSSRNENLQQNRLLDKATLKAKRKREVLGVLKAVKLQMLASTVFVGLSYQAGINVPGGFNQNDNDPINGGTSMLVSKASFEAFIIINTISFLASIIAIFLYTMVWVNKAKGIWKIVFAWASKFTMLSLGLLVTAYVVNLHSTTWKSDICMIIVNIAFIIFVLVCGFFVAGVLRYTRKRPKTILPI